MISNFFELLSKTIDVFTGLDLDDEVAYSKAVDDEKVLISNFMDHFYTVLHVVAKNQGTATELTFMTSIFDVIFGTVMKLDDPDFEYVRNQGYHQEIVDIIKSMDEAEKLRLWKNVEKIQGSFSAGILEDTRNDIIDMKLVPLFTGLFKI